MDPRILTLKHDMGYALKNVYWPLSKRNEIRLKRHRSVSALDPVTNPSTFPKPETGR